MALTKVTYSMIKGAVVSVADFGAVGDGVTNDTQALQDALDSLTGDQVLYFPPGRYAISAAGGLIDQRGLLLTGIDNITISAYGATLFRSDAPGNFNYKPMSVTNCDGFTLMGLSVDNNGSKYFGGYSIYDSKEVIVRHCRFFDSNPGAETSDRYAFVYSDNLGGTSDALFEGNSTDSLQWDVFGQEIRVIGNSWTGKPINRCLGIVTGGSTIRRNILVSGNTFMCGKDSAIGMGTDPDQNTFATVENVMIIGNTFYADSTGGDAAISCNAIGNTNTFRNFSVVGNTMFTSADRSFMNFNNSNLSQYLYSLNVQNNVYRSSATVSTLPVYRFQRVQEGNISNNSAFGSGIQDGFLFDRTVRLTITGNQAEATGKAFELSNPLNSVTGVQLFQNNSWMGAPTTKLSLPTGLNQSDLVQILPSDVETVTISGAGQTVLAAGRRNFILTAAAPSDLTDLSNGYPGQVLTIFFDNANVTVTHGTGVNKILLAGGVNFVGSANDTLTLVNRSSRWYEISRTVI